MPAILPLLGAFAFGALAVACNSKNRSSPSAETPYTVKIPKPDPKGSEKSGVPVKPPKKLCFIPLIESAVFRREIFKKSLEFKETMDPLFQKIHRPGREEVRLVSEMLIKGRMPLAPRNRSSEEVFINFRARLYDYDPDDFLSTMFFGLKVYQCDRQHCDDRDDSRLRAEVLPEPLKIRDDSKVSDADEFWLQPYFEANSRNPRKNNFAVILGYEEGPVAMVTYEQTDLSECLKEEKEIENMLSEDPME